MPSEALLLAGLAFGFIAMLAWLENRAARKRRRHDQAVRRVMGG